MQQCTFGGHLSLLLATNTHRKSIYLLPSPPKGRARVWHLGPYVCLCVCLSAHRRRYLKNHQFDLVENFLWGRVSVWLGPPLKLYQSRKNFFCYDFLNSSLGYIGMYGKHRILMTSDSYRITR